MNISFKQYVEEFNHIHRFSKEFLDKIVVCAEKIYSGDIVMGTRSPTKTVTRLIAYITPLFINMPLLEFFAKTLQASSTFYDDSVGVRVFMLECINKDQLFIDKELLHNRLTSTHLFGLNEVIYYILIYSNSGGVVEYICDHNCCKQMLVNKIS